MQIRPGNVNNERVAVAPSIILLRLPQSKTTNSLQARAPTRRPKPAPSVACLWRGTLSDTKIATMFVSHDLRESADAGRRVSGLGGAVAIVRPQETAKTARRTVGRTEPDLHLIKQVEQVTTSALERRAWRFAGISSVGITDALGALVFLIWQLLHWLLFGCKNSQERPRATWLRRGSPAMLPAPTGGSTSRATWAAEPLPCQIRLLCQIR
jgi:hypothetical protein